MTVEHVTVCNRCKTDSRMDTALTFHRVIVMTDEFGNSEHRDFCDILCWPAVSSAITAEL